jgi:imidazolonepropionase-like amidohydrolase
MHGISAVGSDTHLGPLSLRRIVVAAGLVAALTSCAMQGVGLAPPLAFVDVSVVPMDRERILERQTVIVRGEEIVETGPVESVRVPRGATRIDGRDLFLVPGLVDAHVHFMRPMPAPSDSASDTSRIVGSSSPAFAKENEAFAREFVRNGVTTVRNLWGHPEIDTLAQAIARGALTGPTIYSTGPLTDGAPPVWMGSRVVRNRDEAERAVQQDVARGYVALKLYSRLDAVAYDELVEAARAAGLPLVGHVPRSVSIERVIEARQYSIEHVGELVPGLVSPAVRAGSPADIFARVDLQRLPALAQQLAEAGTWVCPTLVVDNASRRPPPRPTDVARVPTQVVERYARAYPKWGSPPERAALHDQIVAELHRAGVGLVAGTDTYKPGVLPGTPLHDELDAFVRAGLLSPYSALRTATIDAARFLGRGGEFGEVATGQRADLLLVGGSPLLDVGALRDRVGVVIRGRWAAQNLLDDGL